MVISVSEFLRSTRADICARISELEGPVEEYALLSAALEALERGTPKARQASPAGPLFSVAAAKALSAIQVHPGLRREQLAGYTGLAASVVDGALAQLQDAGAAEVLSNGWYIPRRA